jgi:hypothetical protein
MSSRSAGVLCVVSDAPCWHQGRGLRTPSGNKDEAHNTPGPHCSSEVSFVSRMSDLPPASLLPEKDARAAWHEAIEGVMPLRPTRLLPCREIINPLGWLPCKCSAGVRGAVMGWDALAVNPCR